MYIKIVKPFFDYFFALLALPFFCVIFMIIAIAIKLDDGGPIFYKADRVGKNKKLFHMYKFRTMKVNAENILNADGSTYNAKDDPRVTKVGKFLRETSLDETAQILNIINGKMSIIGPRAGDWESVDTYREDELDKVLVKPGITGYTQAYYRNSISVRKKRLYDAWYANNISFCLDLKILFKTIPAVFKRENIYTNSESINSSNSTENQVHDEVNR